MDRHTAALGVIWVAGLAASVTSAQTNATYLITFDGQVTPQNPTMTVGIWATWEDPAREWVFAAGTFDLTAGDGLFTNLRNPLPGTGYIGRTVGNQIIGGNGGQFHLPILGFIGSRDNPILFLIADWTTTDFTPRSVVFETSNTYSFFVAEWGDPFATPPTGGATMQLYPHHFTHGRNVYVIPTPASAAMLGVFAMGVMGRGRRRR